jgi:acetyltransferase-like isoleucine patch superfamily enzyme
MQKLRKFLWDAKDELRAWFFLIVNDWPGQLGVCLRARTYRKYLKHLGSNVVFQSGLRMASPECISIGSNCNFAQRVFMTGGGGIRIGDWVGFGPDTKVWSVNHRFDDPDRPWLLQGWEKKPVVIEDDVWLGANVFVMPGVTIGKGAIVSAGSVVSKSIPAYAIVTGNPGRVIAWRKQAAPAGAQEATKVPMSTDVADKSAPTTNI